MSTVLQNVVARAFAALSIGAIVLVMYFGASSLAWAAGDIEIEVGYSGGPYYHKYTFTEAELAGMSIGPIPYSALDHGGFLRKGWGTGVRIDTLLERANINPKNFWGFYFATKDGYIATTDDGVLAAWSLKDLTSARYYYPNLPYHYDFEFRQVFADGAKELNANRIQVPSILATTTSYYRIDVNDPQAGWSYFDEHPWNGGANAWDDQSRMSTSHAYRLFFGQTNFNEGNAQMNAHSIQRIQCIYKGTPTIVLDKSTVSGEIGQEFTVTAQIISDDPVISEQALKDLQLYNPDPNIATITANGDGTFTIIITGEGEVNVGVTFGNSSSEKFRTGATVGVNRGRGDDPGGGNKDGEPAPGTGKDGAGSGAGLDGEGSGSGGSDELESRGEGVELDGGANLMLVAADAPAAADGFDAAQGEVLALSADAFAAEGLSGLSGGGREALSMLTMDAEEQVPLQAFTVDDNPQLLVVAGIVSLMLLGGIGRVGSFELARDPYAPRRKIEKPKPLVKVGVLGT